MADTLEAPAPAAGALLELSLRVMRLESAVWEAIQYLERCRGTRDHNGDRALQCLRDACQERTDG